MGSNERTLLHGCESERGGSARSCCIEAGADVQPEQASFEWRVRNERHWLHNKATAEALKLLQEATGRTST